MGQTQYKDWQDPKVRAAARERLESLMRAQAITPAFQPIVDLSQAEIAGYEVLSRPASRFGYQHAGELFEDAEALGMLWELEQVTRRATLAGATNWPKGLKLFINSTPLVFSDERFTGDLIDLLTETGDFAPSSIVLEITERSEHQYTESLKTQVARLKAAGFDIAVDDVGAGTSGLNRIMMIRPRWLKLDRDLVENIHQDRIRQNLVRFLVHFSRLSNVKMIAEGIEKREELATLIDLGVQFAQGFFLARPGSRDQTLSPDLVEWLKARRQASHLDQFRDPQTLTLGQIARPAITAQSATPIAEVAAQMLRESATPGVVVMDGTVIIGWSGRDAILRAAGEGRDAQTVGFVARGDSVTLVDSTPLAEAMEIASIRDNAQSGEPIIVSSADATPRIVTIPELLSAAASVAKARQSRTAPLTGLPGRVAADERLTSVIRECRKTHDRGPDVAVVDLRGLTEFNELYGYDLGDQLLRRVVAVLQLFVVREDSRTFLAHLGDDRFLLMAPPGTLLDRLVRMSRHFDRTVAGRIGVENRPISAEAHTKHPHRPTLRSFLFRGVLGSMGSAREFYRLVALERSTIVVPEPDGCVSDLSTVTLHDDPALAAA